MKKTELSSAAHSDVNAQYVQTIKLAVLKEIRNEVNGRRSKGEVSLHLMK